MTGSQNENQIFRDGAEKAESVPSRRVLRRFPAHFVVVWAVEQDLAGSHIERLVDLRLANEHPIRREPGSNLLDCQYLVHIVAPGLYNTIMIWDE
jgi:hypothetical protein